MRILGVASLLAAILTMTSVGAVEYTKTPGAYVDAVTWDGEDVVVIGPDAATGGDITVTVGLSSKETTITGDADGIGLEIVADDTYSSALVFGGTAPQRENIIINGLVFASGDGVSGTTASITLSENYHVDARAGTLLEENSLLSVQGNNSVYRTSDLQLLGSAKSADVVHAAQISLNDNGKLIVTGAAEIGEYAEVAIENGGVLRLAGAGALVSGTGAAIRMGDSSFVSLAKNSVLAVSDGGILDITGSAVIQYAPPDNGNPAAPSHDPFDTAQTEPAGPSVSLVAIGSGGTALVREGASLTVDTIGFAGGGAGTITGTMAVSYLLLDTGGGVNVTGLLRERSGASLVPTLIDVTGGALSIQDGGLIDFTTVQATAGTITLGAAGTMDIASLHVGGSATLSLAGTVTHGNSVQVSGNARAQFQAGMAITTDPGGNAGSLALLAVGDSAVVEMSTALRTDALTLAGGVINMNSGSSLSVLTPGDVTASGRFAFLGNNADVTVNGGLAFTGGGITVENNVTGSIVLNDGGLTLGRSAVIDTSAGALTITGAAGFALNGTLHVGYADGGARITTVQGIGSDGELTIGDTARVTMTPEMQRRALNSIAQGGLQVLKTDAAAMSGLGTIFWDNSSVIFQYDVREDDDGGYGIWVTGVKALSRKEQAAAIVENWRDRPEVGDFVSTLLPPDLVDVIIDANRLVTGVDAGYDSLSVSGKFNAGALSSLANPAMSGAGYDALMLYNGSSLAMASQAGISANARILRAIVRRAEDVRRAIRSTDQLDPDSYTPDPLPPHGLWAQSLYHLDSATTGGGFAGFEYSGSGVIVGIDKLYGNLAIGGALSYLAGNFSDYAALANASRIDAYGIDFYATLSAPSGWFASVAAGYGYTDYRLRDNRRLNGFDGWNAGDTSGNVVKISASLGKDIWIGDSLTLSPSLGLEYVGSGMEAHTQFYMGSGRTDGGADTLAAGSVKNHSTLVPVGLTVNYNFLAGSGVFSLTGNAGYAYEMNDEGAEGVLGYVGLDSAIGIVRRDVGRHMVTGGIRGRYYQGPYEFGFGYEYLGKRHNQQHSLWVDAGVNF